MSAPTFTLADRIRDIRTDWILGVAFVVLYFVFLQPSVMRGQTGGGFWNAVQFFQLWGTGFPYGVAFALASIAMLRSAGCTRSSTTLLVLGVTFGVWVVPLGALLGPMTPLAAGVIAGVAVASIARSVHLGVAVVAISAATVLVWWIDPWIESRTLNRRSEVYGEFEQIPTMFAVWTVGAISAVGWWSVRRARALQASDSGVPASQAALTPPA